MTTTHEHVETFVMEHTGERVHVSCECHLKRDHTHEAWRRAMAKLSAAARQDD